GFCGGVCFTCCQIGVHGTFHGSGARSAYELQGPEQAAVCAIPEDVAMRMVASMRRPVAFPRRPWAQEIELTDSAGQATANYLAHDELPGRALREFVRVGGLGNEVTSGKRQR